jgi:polyvinyl alcohol dehydrogenase (cytochrome)
VAEYVTGKAMTGDVAGSTLGRCRASAPYHDSPQAPRWTGWSPDNANTRVQPSAQARLTPTDVPKLKLKWAFGFPDASVAWSQPTVANGWLFVGSQNGTVYALDAKTGCIRWTFAAGGGVRTALTIGPGIGNAPGVVYFADTAATVYALDAQTGRAIWSRKVEEHPLARITGTPALHDGRVYVPVSSYEEAQGADPQYGCCTFRGSVSALDAASGAVIWKTFMITDPLVRLGTNGAGVPLWGPSGAGIWSSPTIDPVRRRVYVATGNAYSAPAAATSDAVVALDLATGAIQWVRQATAGDVYVNNCRAGNTNCPEQVGPDHDFGSPPMLAALPGGRTVIVIGQKSGQTYAMDPDREGASLWEYRASPGGLLGGVEWGSAVDGRHAYFAVSDITQPQPGGLHAVNLATGERVWVAPPPPAVCVAGRSCNPAQLAALTVIPGIVFSGSNDGALRAFSADTGAVVWTFDSNRDFETVNGVPARGASITGPGPTVVDGMVFVNSGYGALGGRPGNVLLAFGVE